MQSIIEEIFYGKRGQSEGIDYGKGYWEAQSKCCELWTKLENMLNAKQKKILDKIFWACAEQEAEAVRALYVEGFKIGFSIAVECLTK